MSLVPVTVFMKVVNHLVAHDKLLSLSIGKFNNITSLLQSYIIISLKVYNNIL